MMKILIICLFISLPIIQSIQIDKKVNDRFQDQSSQFDSEYLWGTYKPQLIHAISQRNTQTYNPLTIGMMYFDPTVLNDQVDLRYKFDERQNDSIVYNYDYHDGSTFSIHNIYDPVMGTQADCNFFKLNNDNNQQEWVDVIQSYPDIQHNTKYISIIFTIGLEQFNPDVQDLRYLKLYQSSQGYVVEVHSNQTGNDQVEYLTISYQNGQNNNAKIGIQTFATNKSNNWDAFNVMYNPLVNSFTSPFYLFNGKMPSNNINNITFVTIQYIFNQSDSWQLFLHYDTTHANFNKIDLANKKRQAIQKFEYDFLATFYQDPSTKISQFEEICARESFTNLYGGYQFAYGDLNCTNNSLSNCQDYLPMFGFTPSRYGFPRPFLWDEGFHDQLGCQWDAQLCMEDLENWINTQDPLSGWIPREQPRGPELRSYITWLQENPLEANPPTFMYDFLYLMSLNNQDYDNRIRNLFPQLQLWYTWWQNTQGVYYDNGTFSYLFKWWGPSEDLNLGSGMDDWPRSSPGFVSKYNIDASSWAYFFTDSLSKLAQKYVNSSTASYYSNLSKNIKNQIYQQLLDTQQNLFFDLFVSTDNSSNIEFSPHLGYPNFFPLALEIIDLNQKDILIAQANALLNQTTLWTQYGIRSLSKLDPYFGQGSNYWRGPIWINMHYLILRSIKQTYWEVPELQSLYNQLRKNIINTVCNQWSTSGYFFEHFNQDYDGEGHGNHPFNGWTSLITLIILESYISY